MAKPASSRLSLRILFPQDTTQRKVNPTSYRRSRVVHTIGREHGPDEDREESKVRVRSTTKMLLVGLLLPRMKGEVLLPAVGRRGRGLHQRQTSTEPDW